MRKWTLLFLLFHITTCQIDQDNQSDLLHAESSKIIPELLPQDSISIKISKDIEQQTDSILKLAFYPVQIDSLVFDTLIVYSKKGSENTLSNSILVLGYFNKSFDSSYYDLQMGPYLLLSITQDEYTVSSLYYELSQLAVPSILSESQMCKMIQKKYPELKFELNTQNEIKLSFGYTSASHKPSNDNFNQIEEINSVQLENTFYYSAIHSENGYSHFAYYFNAINGQLIGTYYNSILENE